MVLKTAMTSWHWQYWRLRDIGCNISDDDDINTSAVLVEVVMVVQIVWESYDGGVGTGGNDNDGGENNLSDGDCDGK